MSGRMQGDCSRINVYGSIFCIQFYIDESSDMEAIL